ncbi:MAG: AEC family transporter [Puniceicoccaceae bacterium]
MNPSFTSVIGAALPVFLLLGLGYVLRKGKVVAETADTSLLKLLVSVFYPCLYLDYIIGNPALMSVGNLVSAPLIGFVSIVAGFAIAYGVARLLGLQRGTGLRTFSFCNGIYNYGYIPIPIIMALFASRETLGVLLVYNVGVEAAMWTAGIMLLAGKIDRESLKRLVNPPVVALLVALLVNLTGLDGHMPGWLSRPISMLGACSIPLGILLGGAMVADLLTRKGIFDMPKIPLGSIGVRLGILPILFVFFAATLPGLSPELRQVMIIQAAMPAGILPIVLSRHYGGEPKVAIRVVLATTLASIITMPLWIRIGTAVVF